MKFGIRVTPAGTIRVARTSAMITFLPRQRSLARAYPSIGQKIRLPTVTASAMTAELKKNRGKSSWSKSRPYVSTVGDDGSKVGVDWRKSASGLIDPRSIQTKGPTMNTRPMIRTTYAHVADPVRRSVPAPAGGGGGT